MRARTAVTTILIGGLAIAAGIPAAAAPRVAHAAGSDLQLLSVTVDPTGEQAPASAWALGESSATWSPYYGTASYSWQVPASIPATGAVATMSITVHATTERFAPAMGMRGEIVPSTDVTVLAEKGETKTASKQVTITPGAYNPGYKTDLLVGLQDGGHVTFHYVAVRSQQCRAVSFCQEGVAANSPSTVPTVNDITSYQVPKPGGAEGIRLPKLPDTATSASVTVTATTEKGAFGENPFIEGYWLDGISDANGGVAKKVCFLMLIQVPNDPSEYNGAKGSYLDCIRAVTYIMSRHDKIIAAQTHHAVLSPRLRSIASASGPCKTKPLTTSPKVKVTCTAVAHGFKVTITALGGVTLNHVLGPKSKLIVVRSKYSPRTKRFRLRWAAK